MQQNRDRNGRPRNPRPYDLNRDVARTSAPSQNHNTPRSTGNSRYGYNGAVSYTHLTLPTTSRV